MKLNEFKKPKLNEIDLSSFLGDYGSASVRSGLGSLAGKNVLSTTDQMAKDDFVKKFNSRAASGLQSAISGGLVDVAAKGSATPQATTQATTQTTPQTTTQTAPQTNTGALSPEQIRKQKQAAAGAVAQKQMDQNPAVTPTAGKNVSPTPAQTRQQKLTTATTAAQGQMAPKVAGPTPKTPDQIRQAKQTAATQAAQGQMTPKTPTVAADTPKTPDQIRQEKLAAATQSAQGQMNPVSNLPADQFDKSAANVRQQQQNVATQNAQGQMNPVSKLPTDQFAKSADNVRQQQQTTATQTAQQQMAAPQGYQSSDPRYPNGKYDGVTGQPTPEYQKELDKSAAASAEKQKADAAASQAQSKSNDDMAANMNNIAAQRNMPDVPQATTPKISTGADAEQAALDKMKQKNPKLAGMMAQMGMDDEFNDKLNNATKTKKNNKTNSGNQAFGQMAQNLSKVNEGSKFDKLNYLFETILAEQDPEQGSTKQSISQYITNFFKQFMKGVNISDPTVTTQVATLAKELEQTYSKDKGNGTLPKLADLAWSVSHAEAGQEPQQSSTTNKDPNAPDQPETKPAALASGGQKTPLQPAAPKKALTPGRQIGVLLNKLTSTQKKQLLASLEKELGLGQKKPVDKAPTGDTGGTYNKKTGAAKFGGKNMVSAKDLPPNIQKQIPQQ